MGRSESSKLRGEKTKVRSRALSLEMSRTGVANLDYFVGNAMPTITCAGIDAVNVIYASTDGVLFYDSYAHLGDMCTLCAEFLVKRSILIKVAKSGDWLRFQVFANSL